MTNVRREIIRAEELQHGEVVSFMCDTDAKHEV